MRRVTGIATNAHRQGRFDIQVDGQTVATLSLETVERLNLSIGSQWSGETAESAMREAAATATYDRALDTLARRARSTGELAYLLVRRGEPSEHVQAAIERLTTLGLLDDTAYAVGVVRSKIAGAAFSLRRVRTELTRRRVARDVADKAISMVAAEEGPRVRDALDRLTSRKARSLASLSPDVQRRRLWAHLARRGYDVDEIRAAVERLARQSEGDAPETSD
ncbi:MAG TPA: regulatory protein RecX [Gemmatimonadaceae bacterium]|nr:regulatory protein RecX [Gemmatimonadaceae bacterium]